MRLKSLYIAAAGSLFFILFSCRNSEKQGSVANVTSEGKPAIKLKLDRFEQDLFSIPLDSIRNYVPKIQARYGKFFDIFTNKIIEIGDNKAPEFPRYLKTFLTDYYMNQTYKRVKQVIPTITNEFAEIETAFNRYHSYFPDKKLPHIYTMVSGFHESIITADTILGISLENYLGPNCDFYPRLEIPQYQSYLMGREYMSTDALRVWSINEFVFNDSASNVLNNILYEGKIIYLMKQLFPDKPDTIIMGMKPAKLEWCINNQKEMWTFLLERKLMFSTDYMTIQKLIYPAPFTSLFNNDSPGRAVVWLGYQIIESYMKNNTQTLEQLMKDTNYQEILEKSKFKP